VDGSVVVGTFEGAVVEVFVPTTAVVVWLIWVVVVGCNVVVESPDVLS
jgi:hypothetical protein